MTINIAIVMQIALQNGEVYDIIITRKDGFTMIYCENYLCTYWKKEKEHGKCICDSIEIDNAGVCQSCIYFINESENLDKLRSRALEKEKN